MRIGLLGLAFLFITFSLSAQRDFLKVKGKVVNSENQPIPYANIIIPGKHKGTISDKNGDFSFIGQENDTLLFSCMGFKATKYIIPEVTYPELEFVIVMHTDTIYLKEATVLPWRTYTEFKEAFMEAKPPKNDLDRANDNLAMIRKQMIYQNEDPDAMPSPTASYHYYMQGIYDQMYFKGQSQPISILNPIAWSKFFKALQNGDFKQKKNEDD